MAPCLGVLMLSGTLFHCCSKRRYVIMLCSVVLSVVAHLTDYPIKIYHSSFFICLPKKYISFGLA
jgi:hypothetical protein